MPCKWDNRAVRASRQMRQEKSRALGSHSLEEPLRASEKLSLVMEPKIFRFDASPTCRSWSSVLRPLAGTGQLLPPTQSWAPAALQPALHNLHEMSESAWMRNGEILWKRSRSNGNVKNIPEGKEVLPSQPLCLNTSRFLVRIMVFTSLTSKLLLVPSSYSVLVQNPGSRSTTSGFQITEGKQGGILIRSAL